MKKLIIGATLLAIGCVTAMTQEGTTPVVPQSLPTAAPAPALDVSTLYAIRDRLAGALAEARAA